MNASAQVEGFRHERPLEFRPIQQAGVRQWSRPHRLTFLDALIMVPIGDTELLNLSHYAPIAIRLGPAGPEVMLILHSALSRAELLNAQQQWAPPYAPLAIRCLPFRSAGPDLEPDFDIGLCSPLAEQHDFFGPDSKPSREFAYVLEMLQRLNKGTQRLSNAAKVLLAADCLVPLAPTEGEADLRLMAVSKVRICALSGARAAALTADSNLPYELAAASIYSQRWLVKPSIQDVPVKSQPQPMQSPTRHFDYGPNNSFEEPLLMDDGDLFSIDAFLQQSTSDNDRT